MLIFCIYGCICHKTKEKRARREEKRMRKHLNYIIMKWPTSRWWHKIGEIDWNTRMLNERDENNGLKFAFNLWLWSLPNDGTSKSHEMKYLSIPDPTEMYLSTEDESHQFQNWDIKQSHKTLWGEFMYMKQFIIWCIFGKMNDITRDDRGKLGISMCQNYRQHNHN